METPRPRPDLVPLRGATIISVCMHPSAFGEPMPVLIVQAVDGTTHAVEVWRDAEGNGAGALSVFALGAPVSA